MDEDYSRPFRVVILEDCRPAEGYGPAGNLTGKRGICLGEYVVPENRSIPDVSKKATPEQRAASIEALLDPTRDEVNLVNPLILADTGDYIWGMECYFSKAGDLKDVPEEVWPTIPETLRQMLRAHLN